MHRACGQWGALCRSQHCRQKECSRGQKRPSSSRRPSTRTACTLGRTDRPREKGSPVAFSSGHPCGRRRQLGAQQLQPQPGSRSCSFSQVAPAPLFLCQLCIPSLNGPLPGSAHFGSHNLLPLVPLFSNAQRAFSFSSTVLTKSLALATKLPEHRASV